MQSKFFFNRYISRSIKAVFFLFLGLCLLGMSAAPDQSVIKVPEARQNYAVTVVDHSDVSTELVMFSCEGQTYFLGKRGEMEISVDFANIKEARFYYQEPQVRAQLTLENAKTLELLINPNLPCYGRSRWGNVRIKVKNIKSLVFQGIVPVE